MNHQWRGFAGGGFMIIVTIGVSALMSALQIPEWAIMVIAPIVALPTTLMSVWIAEPTMLVAALQGLREPRPRKYYNDHRFVGHPFSSVVRSGPTLLDGYNAIVTVLDSAPDIEQRCRALGVTPASFEDKYAVECRDGMWLYKHDAYWYLLQFESQRVRAERSLSARKE